MCVYHQLWLKYAENRNSLKTWHVQRPTLAGAGLLVSSLRHDRMRAGNALDYGAVQVVLTRVQTSLQGSALHEHAYIQR